MYTTRITVCIPAYNRPDYLRDALESLCDQGLAKEEYVVAISDDASPTGLEPVTSAFLDKLQIVYRREPRNVGHIANFAKAFELAETPYVSLLPHDDIMAPGQLGRLLPLLERDPRLVLGASRVLFQRYSGATRTYLHGIYLRGSAAKPFAEPYYWDRSEWMASALVSTPLNMVGAIYHAETFRKCQQWKKYPMWHDRVWCAEMGLQGGVVSLPWIGGYYRVSDTQMSARLAKSNTNEFCEVSKLVLRLCEAAKIPVIEFWMGHVCQATPEDRIIYVNMLKHALPSEVFSSLKKECERRLQTRLHLGGRLEMMGIPEPLVKILRKTDSFLAGRLGKA